MATKNDHISKKSKKLLAWYNMIPNLVWSIINLTPILIFCLSLIDLRTIYIFLAISSVPAFLKNSFIDKLQIGKTAAIYKKLGVHFINKVAQNGVIINDLVRKKFPDHKIVNQDRRSIARLIYQTYVFEKFHLVLFVFFDLIIAYALIQSYWSWAFIILLTNIAYNVYPNFLQQYIRLKLILFNKRL